MILQRLREPDIATISYEDGVTALEKGPPVIWVGRRFLAEYPTIYPMVLRAWGYRMVEYHPPMGAHLYVRPLPLWAVHKVVHLAYVGFWSSLRWLYRRGIIRLTTPEGCRTRLRDIRPWPLRGRRYARD